MKLLRACIVSALLLMITGSSRICLYYDCLSDLQCFQYYSVTMGKGY